jgi:molybdopterin-guanine dinucleotide biosynthesis protein A
MPAGVVLAGGRSTRFGDRDKAVAPLAGTPMIRRVADRLEPAVDALVINCRPDQRGAIADALAGYAHPPRFALDRDPDQGPMAGIGRGLRVVAENTDHEYGAVVACDMPFVDPAVVSLLAERAAGHDAAVPEMDDGWYQTTQAVYRAPAMADACEGALARGEGKILAPLETLDWVAVPEADVRAVGDPDTFRNLNTQAEFDAAASEFD